MADQLLLLAASQWVAAAVAGLGGAVTLARVGLSAGAAAGIAAALVALPQAGQAVALPGRLAGDAVTYRIEPEALWLLGFGLAPAGLVCALGPPSQRGRRGWLCGAAASLLGALGVFGLQDGAGLLIAWELMSLGGGLMVLSEDLSEGRGRSVLFMLVLLEVGAIALMLAVAILGSQVSTLDLTRFGDAAAALSPAARTGVGLMLLAGFGAKLGLLPFYEWFPGAYGSGSGASGAIMSGVVLNAAFFALSRALTGWLPAAPGGAFPTLAVAVVGVAGLSAVLTILYAFQQDDWRRLLAFSSAENASIAVVALGAAMLFRDDGLADLAGLAWTVALLHLAGHSLAKGTLFLAADALRQATGGYHIGYGGAGGAWLLGVATLVAGMSLAAMPPTAGFVSEWFVFQTAFQGFHVPGLAGRLTLALAGAGLALTAAVSFATLVKVVGIGVLGRDRARPLRIEGAYSASTGLLGLGVLALGVGMPVWLRGLDVASGQFGEQVAPRMHEGALLVPLTSKFAFISPSLLAIAVPLLSLLPIGLLLLGRQRPIRRAAVWYGGLAPDPALASTTALSFSNALRTFYSFVYRPTADTQRVADAGGYFVRRLSFEHDVAPIFGPTLFRPTVRAVEAVAGRLRLLQSGSLNLYVGLIGAILVLVLALSLP